MNFPGLDNQVYTDSNLKGFLLKKVDPKTQNPTIKELNRYLIKRVDQFWEQVVVPLREKGSFKGDKIEWYYQVYNEGIDAHKLNEHPFVHLNITRETIEEIVEFFKGRTIEQYLELGTSYLSNTFSLLSSFIRDQLVLYRLEHIYASGKPHEWILAAEKEENGVMGAKYTEIKGLQETLQNIGLLMSRAK